MINRYSLLAFAGVVFCLTSSAYAQTVKDAPSNIQAVLQKFSEMRTQLKQVQSSLNIEKMAANAAGYDRVFIHNAQVFPGVRTLQQLVLIPTPTLPKSYAQTQEFDIPAQDQDL